MSYVVKAKGSAIDCPDCGNTFHLEDVVVEELELFECSHCGADLQIIDGYVEVLEDDDYEDEDEDNYYDDVDD